MQSGQTQYHTNGYDVTFDNVSFAYEEGKSVLNSVSFTARQGQVTALVGPSGGGKSTVAKLASRFYNPSGGRITLGGVDIAGIDPVALMKEFSIVFQDVVLFNNTIMENIRVGRKDASDEEVIAAAKAAMCDDFISALLKDAPVILLDEATASLDVDNETQIQEAISKLVCGKTVLVIAHRMRTIEASDQIIVLDNGFVAESGTHDELMQKRLLPEAGRPADSLRKLEASRIVPENSKGRDASRPFTHSSVSLVNQPIMLKIKNILTYLKFEINMLL